MLATAHVLEECRCLKDTDDDGRLCVLCSMWRKQLTAGCWLAVATSGFQNLPRLSTGLVVQLQKSIALADGQLRRATCSVMLYESC